MSTEHLTHATITRAGEVDFPLWVKAVAAMLSILMPIAIAAAVWQGSQIFDMSIRMARMEASLARANADSAAASLALSKASLTEQRLERAERDIGEIKASLNGK